MLHLPVCQGVRGATVGGSASSGIPLSAVLLLLLTGSLSLVWSHFRLLFRDEFYEMWTDRVSSLGEVIAIQRTHPVSLDPLAYHVLGHASIRIFGANTFALRLPALLGVLLMQGCLFVFVRRISSERAAVFAMGFPALTYVMGYSMEGRPYGLLLACFGVTMVCWQTAARGETGRTLALVTLSLALAVALNTHYFGVLLLGPLCVAELFRTFQRKRLDVAMLTSLAAGSMAIILVLPFMKAAKAYHQAYTGGVSPVVSLLSPKAIVWCYIWTFANHSGSGLDRAIFAVVAIVVCFSLWGYARRLRGKAIASYEPGEVFLIALAGLPFFGYVVALVTSPVLEPRFVIALVIGIAGLTALGLFSLCSNERREKLAVNALFVLIAFTGIAHIGLERNARREMLDSLKLQPEIRAALLAGPNQRIYIQDLETFAFLMFYESDSEVRSRIALVYSEEQEVKWNQESVISIAALYLHDFAHLSIAPYEQVAALPEEQIFIDFAQPSIRMGKQRGLNWIGLALVADHTSTQLLGHAFLAMVRSGGVMGDVLSVTFRR